MAKKEDSFFINNHKLKNKIVKVVREPYMIKEIEYKLVNCVGTVKNSCYSWDRKVYHQIYKIKGNNSLCLKEWWIPEECLILNKG